MGITTHSQFAIEMPEASIALNPSSKPCAGHRKDAVSEASNLQRTITPDKRNSANKKSDNVKVDFVGNIEEDSPSNLCCFCSEDRVLCYKVQFCQYCSDVVDAQFCQTPLYMSKKVLNLHLLRPTIGPWTLTLTQRYLPPTQPVCMKK